MNGYDGNTDACTRKKLLATDQCTAEISLQLCKKKDMEMSCFDPLTGVLPEQRANRLASLSGSQLDELVNDRNSKKTKDDTNCLMMFGFIKQIVNGLEARVLSAFASCDSYAFVVLRNLPCATIIRRMKGVVSKETVVLRRWGSSIQKFGGINSMTLGSLSTRVFEMRTATGREHFAYQDSGVSQSFILIISNGEKILSNINVLCEGKLKGKTAHFRLPSASQKCACLSSLLFIQDVDKRPSTRQEFSSFGGR